MRRFPLSPQIPLAAVCLVAAITAGARADVLLLASGGKIYGRWTNRDARPLDRYVMELEEGGRLTIAAGQVRRAIIEDPREQAYRSLAATSPDTVDGHWKVAQWCLEQGLRDRREAHLRRILELDPDHVGARRGLGYAQFRGQWATREQTQQNRGYQLHEGRWMLPQEITLQQGRQRLEQAQKEWFTQLRRSREQLGSENHRLALQRFAAVKDPHAVPALQQLLREEPYRDVKLIYVEILERIGDRPAIGTLADTSLQDPDEEVFQACLDALVRLHPPHLAPQYVQALKDKNNVRLNRAAHALGRLGDRSVLSPLIDALITTHYYVIPAKSDAYTATFLSPNAPGGAEPAGAPPVSGNGLTAGDQTKVIPCTVTNQDVLQALIGLSGGANFGFDQRAWRFWLAGQNQQLVPAGTSLRDGAGS